MSPGLRSAFWLLAVTLLILAAEVHSEYETNAELTAENERVKRQTILLSFGLRQNRLQEVTLLVNGTDTEIILNHPNYLSLALESGDEITYMSDSIVIVFGLSSETNATSDITKFTLVDSNGVVRDFADGMTLPGPGTLYLQPPRALYVNNARIASSLNQFIRSLSLPPIIELRYAEVMVVMRTTPTDNLVLNIDSAARDGIFDPDDDILELTGSSTFLIPDNQDLLYDGDRLLVIDRNSLAQQFDSISNLYTLRPFLTTGVSVPGRNFEIFNTSNTQTPRAFSGPGVLRVGMNRGQEVALYSTVSDVNQFITSELVSRSFRFQASEGNAEIIAEFPPSLMDTRLISLVGAESFSFPDATSVRTMGSQVTVLSEQGVIQRFDTGQTPFFSAFIGHQVTRTNIDRNYDVPPGGATLLFNPNVNEFFLYPSRNGIISTNVAMAVEEANVVQEVITGDFSFETSFGVATLTIRTNEMPIRNFMIGVRPATTFDVGPSQTISYKGMTIEILGSGGEQRRIFENVTPFIVNLNEGQLIIENDTSVTSFGGPGRLYIDSNNNAFYTRSQDIQNFITNFISRIRQPMVSLVRDVMDGQIYFRSGNRNLLQVNGGTTVTSGRAGIFFNNEVNFVDTYNIPNNARATFDSTTNILSVVDLTTGERLFNIPIPNLLYQFNDSPSFQGGRPMVDTLGTGNNHVFPFTNGIIYFSGLGALVSSSDAITQGIYDTLFQTGGLQASQSRIQNVGNFTVADGNSVVSYENSVPFLLREGGTYYFSGSQPANGMYFDTDSYRTFLGSVTRTFSQLNPTRVTYNSTTRVLSLQTNEGIDISSFVVGETEPRQITQGVTILWENETIFFIDGDGDVIEFITGVDEFRVWNGFETILYDRSTVGSVRVNGPGVFWADGFQAFFTNDTVATRRITNRFRDVMATFRLPEISRVARTFRSKFRTVDGGFPHTITVYEGADVNLNCRIAASNPAGSISFFERINGSDVEIQDSDVGFTITSNPSTNSAVLTVENVPVTSQGESRVFGCSVRNVIGLDMAVSQITVLPAQAPAIVGSFIPPLSYVQDTNERLETVAPGDNLNMLAINRRFYTIRGSTPIDGVDPADDGFTIIRTLHIGCKAEGLPKSEITWYQLDDSSETDLNSINRVLINGSEDRVEITEPRQGRSVLSIMFEQEAPRCTRYICSATNAAGTVLGGADICTQAYECGSDIGQGLCSATCGLGLASQRYTSCVRRRDPTVFAPPTDLVSVPYETIPSGLFPLGLVFCGSISDPCPVMSFEYVVENISNCSVTCGCGMQTQDVACRQIITVGGVVMNNTVTVPEIYCQGQSRPLDRIQCFNPPCPRYREGPFGECSATCRGGIRMREVTCIQAEFDPNSMTFEVIMDDDNNFNYTLVNDTLCMEENIPRPAETIPCNDHIDCPFRYKVGDWSECLEGRRVHCQTRDILCENYDPNDYFWPGPCVDISNCDDPELKLVRPHPVRSCGGGACNFGVWAATTLGSCSVTCGRGVQLYNVVCVDRTNGTLLHEGYCDPAKRPDDVQICACNCEGQCFTEPDACQIFQFIPCDTASLMNMAIQCCKTCPKIATSPTDKPTLDPNAIVIAPN